MSEEQESTGVETVEKTEGEGGDHSTAAGEGEDEVGDGKLWFYGKLKKSIRIAEINPRNLPIWISCRRVPW